MVDDGNTYLDGDDAVGEKVIWEGEDTIMGAGWTPEPVWIVDNTKKGRFELSANNRYQFQISYDVFEKVCMATLEHIRRKRQGK